MSWITRELNRLGAPKDHRAKSQRWRHGLVANLLSREKYVGVWRWGEGKNVRDPETGQIRQEARDDEETHKWTRTFPNLRIIDDETFYAAQRSLRRLAPCLATLDGEPRHLLSGLIRCGECGATFYVGGAHGKYLFCPGNRHGVCRCKTTLNRRRAEEMILQVIGERINADAPWFDAVYDRLIRAWRQSEEQLPQELIAAERALSDIDQKINRLVDQIEAGIDDPEVKSRLNKPRDERRDLTRRLDRLRRGVEGRSPQPLANGYASNWLTSVGSCKVVRRLRLMQFATSWEAIVVDFQFVTPDNVAKSIPYYVFTVRVGDYRVP